MGFETSRRAWSRQAVVRALVLMGALVSSGAAHTQSQPDPNAALSIVGEILREDEQIAEDAKSRYGADSLEYAKALKTVAALLAATRSDLDKAEKVYRLVLAIDEKNLGPDHPEVASDLNKLAWLLHDRPSPRYDEVEKLWRRVLEIHKRNLGPDDPVVAADHNNLALVLKQTNRLAEAEEHYRRALAMGENYTHLANFANLLDDTGRFAEAERLYRRALQIVEKTFSPDHVVIASYINSLAVLLHNTNRLPEAEQLYRRALKINETGFGPDHSTVAIRLNNLAVLLGNKGSFDEAKEAEVLFRRALAIHEKLDPESHDVAMTASNLGEVLRKMDRPAEAEPLIRRALEIDKKNFGPDHPAVATHLNNLALVVGDIGQGDEAERLLRRALAIDEQSYGPDHPSVADQLNNLAVLLSERGDWAGALAFHAQAKPILISQSRKRGADRTNLAKSMLAKNSLNFRAIARAAHHASTDNIAEGFELSQWALQSEAAEALSQMAARLAKGQGPLAGLLREQQDLIARQRGAMHLLDEAIARADSQVADAARSKIAVLDRRLDEIDVQLANKEELEHYRALSNPEPLTVADVSGLLKHDEVLIAILDTPDFIKLGGETLIWVVTQAGTSRWARIDLGTEALTDKVQALRCGLDDAEWEGIGRPAQCNKLLGVGLPGEKDPLPFSFAMAHELYEALLGPVKDLIKDKHLLIVPSGPLTSLPFQVLVTDPPKVPIGLKYEDYRDVAWLARKQAITVLPSVASLKALREFAKGSPGSGVYVGYGDPVLSGNPDCPGGTDVPEACPGSTQMVEVASLSPRRERRGRRSAGLDRVFGKGGSQEAVLTEVRSLCPLPDTAQEIRCVARSLGVPDSEIRLKETATETDIKGLSESGKLATYKVIHFATHGLLAGDVEIMAKRQGEPALVLTPPESPKDADDDGLLTASEVTQLKLNADWVILSACNTAAGEKLGAEALSGLARAFFYAGDRALLVSHWPVYSDAAVRLITGTFAELKAHPEIGRAEAQRRAMVALMDDASQHDNPHPAVWAPFVVVGDGGVAAP